MDRLTRRELSKDGKLMCYDLVCVGKDLCNDSCMYGTCNWSKEALQKLKYYEDLECKGKLIKLPCAVGTSIFKICNYLDCEKEYKCHRYNDLGDDACNGCNLEFVKYYISGKYVFDYSMINKIGITVFLTEQEAEQMLAKLAESEEGNR